MDVLNAVFRVVEGEDTLYGRILHPGCFAGPVARGGNHEHGAGGHQGTHLHIGVVEAEDGSVLTKAAALHAGGDHVDRCGNLDARVDGREGEGLGAPTRCARAADAVGGHFGKGLEKVDGPNGGPELKGKGMDAPELFFFRAPVVGELDAVLVTNHVIHEGDDAHARQGDAPGRDRAPFAFFRAAIGPVSVGGDHAGKGAIPQGFVEIARDEETGIGFELDLFHRVVVVGDFSGKLGV